MMVMPSLLSFLKRRMMSSAWPEWRLPVGSSARINFGFAMIARAIADELLLSAGKLARIEIFFPDDRESDRACRRRAPSARDLLIVPIGKRDVEVLVNGQVVEQVVVLKNETDLLVAQRACALSASGRWTAVSSR